MRRREGGAGGGGRERLCERSGGREGRRGDGGLRIASGPAGFTAAGLPARWWGEPGLPAAGPPVGSGGPGEGITALRAVAQSDFRLDAERKLN